MDPLVIEGNFINIDEFKILQALKNLISNSIKFTKKKGGMITITLRIADRIIDQDQFKQKYK